MDIRETADVAISKVEAENWNHGFAEVDGVRLHYVDEGDGFPVLLVHGMPEFWYVYRHQIRALAEAGFRAIALDSRGFGQSGRPEGIQNYTIQKHAGDLVGLLDVLGLEKAVIVGHDRGTQWVWYAGARYPERVERIVCTLGLISRRSFLVQTERPDNRFTEGFEQLFRPFVWPDRWQSRVSWWDLRAPGYAEQELAKDPDWLEALIRSCQAPTRGPFPTREFIRAHIDQYGTADSMYGPFNTYRNIGINTETTMEFVLTSRITCPCMLLAAEEDPWAPEKGSDLTIMEVMRNVPNLTVRWIKDCGHWAQNERPEEFNRQVLDFLKELEG